MPMRMLPALLALVVAPAAAFVAGPMAPRASTALRPVSASKPTMLLTGAPIQPAVIAATTELLAKSEADELLEEFFINFPTLFTGICLAFFVVQYIQSSQLNSLVPDLPFPFEFFVIPSFVIVFVLAGKFGVLGSISAVVAKASLDAWDVFAAAVLPGAILKY